MIRKKIFKIVVKLITGLCLVIYFTTSGIIGTQTVKATPMPNVDYTVVYKNVDRSMTVANQVQLTNGLIKIGNSYDFKDVKFLQFVIDVEKKFNLQPCELLALINVENSFTDKTIVEADGITSYNVSQMRFGTAKIAHKKLAEKGFNIPAPTEELLQYNRNYVVMLTGGYLQHLHEKYPNTLEAWTAYNAGEGATHKFKSINYKYSYTERMQKKMVEFKSIIGEAYLK